MTAAVDQDHAATIAAGSQSFAKAARLLPPDVRRDVLRLYAWCRYGDDQIDGQDLGQQRETLDEVTRVQRLAALRWQTQAALDRKPGKQSAMQALAAAHANHHFNPDHVMALIDGFALDVGYAVYPSFNDTLRYCYHVAGAIGLLMARIMGVRDDTVRGRDTLDRACDLGLAFQLTNIARDLVEDARHGHTYAPQAWLAAHGLRQVDIAQARKPQATLDLAQALVTAAKPYYRSAYYGAMQLPLRSAWAIHAALLIYRGIGGQIMQAKEQLPARARTSSRYKMWLVAKAGVIALYGRWLGRYRQVPPRAGLWNRPPSAELGQRPF